MTDKVAIALFKGLMQGMAMLTEAVCRAGGDRTEHMARDTGYWFNVTIKMAVDEAKKNDETSKD